MGRDFLVDKQVINNVIIYCFFIFITLVGSLYGQTVKDNYAFLRVWDYQNVLVLLIGIPFLFFQSKADLPDFYEVRISNKQRWLLPVGIGAVFGILDIIVVKLILHPEPYLELPPFLQPFPYSLFLYFSGAFEIEVFYRLVPITFLLVLGNWFAKGKYYNAFFWTAVVLTSLREPLEQLPDGEILFVVYSLLTGFLMNFLQAIHYKKSGFLASLALRLGHYLFWHILLGIYVQYLELA